MYVWKDDNALFFKFFHMNETVGFFGPGYIGTGLYRFLVLPHWWIFKLFGTQQIWPFYLQTLVFYGLATLAVYKLFVRLFGFQVGRLAGFLYACGYIASEAFYWLNESLMHSFSTILVCLTLICYHRFAQSRRVIHYFQTVVMYFLTVFIVQARSHYIFGMLVVFDLLWVVQKRTWRAFGEFLFRMVPLTVIFYVFYVRDVDQRAQAIPDYLHAVLAGKFYYLYSLFGTVGNMFIPDVELKMLVSSLPQWFLKPTHFVVVEACLALLFVAGFYWINRKVWSSLLLLVGSLIWVKLSQLLVSAPQVSFSLVGWLAVFFAGELFLLVMLSWWQAKSEIKKGWFFLSFWMMANLFGYLAYVPFNSYDTYERYLAHSFIPLVGLLALFIIRYQSKILLSLVVVWGIVNLGNSVVYQHTFVAERSTPARQFYQQLATFMPQLSRGDVVYIEISPMMNEKYRAAFSVGSMPENTAIAWRYGLDRSDFQMVNTFPDFQQLAKAGLDPQKVHSFFYTPAGLVDTTTESRTWLAKQQPSQTRTTQAISSDPKMGTTVQLDSLVEISTPKKMRLQITAEPAAFQKPAPAPSSLSDDQKVLSLSYLQEKQNQLQHSHYTASSQWQDRIVEKVHDGDPDTAWQADRILWKDKTAFVQLELPVVEDVDRLVWINGFTNNTPTDYQILVSEDGVVWQKVKDVHQLLRVHDDAPQVVSFPSHQARFVRMMMTNTISEDAPALGEMWVIPSKYDTLDILQTEEFLKNPFASLTTKEMFDQFLQLTGSVGTIQVSWKKSNDDRWTTAHTAQLNVIYDGQVHTFEVSLPVGEIEAFDQLKFSGAQIPGTIKIDQVEIQPDYTFAHD